MIKIKLFSLTSLEILWETRQTLQQGTDTKHVSPRLTLNIWLMSLGQSRPRLALTDPEVLRDPTKHSTHSRQMHEIHVPKMKWSVKEFSFFLKTGKVQRGYFSSKQKRFVFRVLHSVWELSNFWTSFEITTLIIIEGEENFSSDRNENKGYDFF